MGKLVLPFHSWTARAPQVASRRLVNCHAEQGPPQGKAPVVLMRSPGVRTIATLPKGPVRGMCAHGGVLYVVAGNALYSVTPGGGYTDLGTIPGYGRVSMASNGVQLVIVASPWGYVYDGALTEISDDDFTSRGAGQVAIMDSFALFIEPNSGRFFHSETPLIGDPPDATVYDALDFATAEGAPDDLVALLVDHRQIFLFGTSSIELWYNAGNEGTPFAREANGLIESGCGAAWSPAKADNTVFWLSPQRIAYRLNDLTPQRISTHALEQAWAGYERIDDAVGFAFQHEGHTFYALTFPGEGTFLYDAATGEWHERRSRRTNGGDEAWRVNAHAFAYGQNWVGDNRSGRVGVLDAECYTEFGEPLRMEWQYPAVYADGRRAFHHRLQVMIESGVGLTTGQGSNPAVMLYVSNDGGVTFDAGPSRTFGEVGQYRWRSTWNRLGSADDRVYRCAVSDPVPVTVIDTVLEVEGGRL